MLKPIIFSVKVLKNSNLQFFCMSLEANSRIRIKVKAYDSKLLDQSVRQIVDTARRSGAIFHGPIPLPTEKKRWTVLKSTFVYKNSREQFEMRIHKRLIDIVNATAKTVEALTNLSLPAGVDVSIKMM